MAVITDDSSRRMLVNIHKQMRFKKTGSKKKVWRSKDPTEAKWMKAVRIGPDVDGGIMEYKLSWRGGWGIVRPHEIRSLILLLQEIRLDAEGRVWWDEEKKG